VEIKISLQELWDGFNPTGFGEGLFVVLRGYIDESYDGADVPCMFNLTCTMAQGSEWSWIELAWQRCLDEKNAALRAQGRRPISRYHSVDINNFREEFADWNGPERQAFCEKLLKVFSRHTLRYEGCLINAQELIEEWPEAKADPKAYAYEILLGFLMIRIGKSMSRLPNSKITIFHDRGPYDGTFLYAFNALMGDPTFQYKHSFTTIAPMGWEDCVALQPADLIAYENFKEGYRLQPNGPPRKRRKILDEIRSLESFSQRLSLVTRENIRELRDLRMRRTKSDEYQKFNHTMEQLIKVPHSELKARLDAEKDAKKRKVKKPSASDRA
jgi:hypothetical protein